MNKSKDSPRGDVFLVPLILRREIEARYLQALLPELCQAFGKEEVRRVVSRGVLREARHQGKTMAREYPARGCEDLQKIVEGWNRGGALGSHLEEASAKRFTFRVVRCDFADMYRRLGLEEWGFILSCQRDFAFLEGFNPQARLTRPHTLMEGHECCDFDYIFEKDMEDTRRHGAYDS